MSFHCCVWVNSSNEVNILSHKQKTNPTSFELSPHKYWPIKFIPTIISHILLWTRRIKLPVFISLLKFDWTFDAHAHKMMNKILFFKHNNGHFFPNLHPPSACKKVETIHSTYRPVNEIKVRIAKRLNPCLSCKTPRFNSRLLPLRPLSKALTYFWSSGHISMVPQLA